MAGEKKPSGYWVIFIHGGAWRDPDIDSAFASATVSELRNSPLCRSVEGLASLNYRLSPYTDHPTRPSAADDCNRNAIHPDHLIDVVTGIEYLQRRFKFGNRYILLGHSCGATLAFQTITEKLALSEIHGMELSYPFPQAIVGVAGLYDLVLLRDMDPEPPMCQKFLTSAFGSDEDIWKDQSPVSGDYQSLWSEGRAAVLAVCREDEYVSPEQSNVMENRLRPWVNQSGRMLKKLVLGGHHDDCWRLGHGLRTCIEEALALLLDKAEAE
ncbi:hypothetical protein K432DRAFT_304090 [Lepidopterella palustris CBS 459.81]|uniref:BD-FAE-like domain-containing protein n=1 Tax=Lepidopterella palustris CBS 459.81 TaxID=1314670 RepID=A0A8E2JCG2_9PEZI|nr:hypothetical protein K432DRAFT_304090 [Lepidopterella palustris CBS 459.81]